MKTAVLLTGLLWCCEGASPRGGAEAARPPEGLQPGVVYVFFDDEGFQRPGSHGLQEGIKSHGVATEIHSHGVQEQIDLAIEGINSFSKLWIGQIRFPVGGEITFSTEVDNGMRVFLDGRPVLDCWSPDDARAGQIHVTAGQLLPLRVEYFQAGGESYARLDWQWKGQPNTLVPPSAFWHGRKDFEYARAIADGEQSVSPGNAPPVISVPCGGEEFKSSIYRPKAHPEDRSGEPIRLNVGPHLFIDDDLIQQCRNVTRRVNRPRRDPRIPNPLITGKEDHCNGPYMTVVRDVETGRFRIWYNCHREMYKVATSRFAYMESEDGIRWIRPHRVLKDPGPINFGSAVIDEGPGFADPARRYKLAWWNQGGLKIAVSANGLDWTMLRPYPVLRHNHDINNIFRDTARNCYMATLSVFTTGPTWRGRRRTTMMSVSRDLLNWEKPWYVLTPDDRVDEGQAQFYAMNGYLRRGQLLIGLVKVLRDDLQAPGTPKEAYGVGYTTLAWTRDGEHWVRDVEPFFQPDPNVDAWDHAHAWMDFQLPVGDEVYIYYGGYKYGHKMNRWEGRQIGLVRMKRDRYVSRHAGPKGGTLLTRTLILAGDKMTVNAKVEGELRVRLLDRAGKPVPGFDLEDSQPVKGDSLAHAIGWKASPARLPQKPVQVEFTLRDAELYGFDLQYGSFE